MSNSRTISAFTFCTALLTSAVSCQHNDRSRANSRCATVDSELALLDLDVRGRPRQDRHAELRHHGREQQPGRLASKLISYDSPASRIAQSTRLRIVFGALGSTSGIRAIASSGTGSSGTGNPGHVIRYSVSVSSR